MVKKIGFVTGTRAEYGLLKPMMDLVRDDIQLSLMLYVTGMHLSPEFGKTIGYIEQDGFPVTERIEILLSSDSPVGISKSMGLALIGFAEAFMRSRPDIIVILGDRFEAFCAAASAVVAGIPVAHIHGGELTEGAIDDAFRHSITKMSYLHFTSTEIYRQRVIRMGEEPTRVFNVGAPGVENISLLKLMTRAELESSLKTSLGEKMALVTYHPATAIGGNAQHDMTSLFDALDRHPELYVIFTKANADYEGRHINTMIDEYVAKRQARSIVFASMGQLRYLSAMKLSSVVIGNSSSGLIEAPTLKIPTVNIGDRQKGRVRATSILDCDASVDSIDFAITTALSPVFSQTIETVVNPYYKANTSRAIVQTIKEALESGIGIKGFYEGGT